MSFERGLSELLRNEPSINTLVSSGPFWTLIPAGSKQPCVVMHRIVSVPLVTLRATLPLVETRVQFDCYGGGDALAATDLATAVGDFLADYNGTMPDGTIVQACVLNNIFDAPFELGGKNVVIKKAVDISIWFTTSGLPPVTFEVQVPDIDGGDF